MGSTGAMLRCLCSATYRNIENALIRVHDLVNGTTDDQDSKVHNSHPFNTLYISLPILGTYTCIFM